MTNADFAFEIHAPAADGARSLCREAGIMPTDVIGYTMDRRPRRVTCPECRRIATEGR